MDDLTLGKKIMIFSLGDQEGRIAHIISQPVAEANAFNRKIFAIKETRKITGWGLRESKEFVDDLAHRIGIHLPDHRVIT